MKYLPAVRTGAYGPGILYFLAWLCCGIQAVWPLSPITGKTGLSAFDLSDCSASAQDIRLAEALDRLYHFDFQRADSLVGLMETKCPEDAATWFARAQYAWHQLISREASMFWENTYREILAGALANRQSLSARSTQMTEAYWRDMFYHIQLYAMQARLDLKNGAMIRSLNYLRQTMIQLEASLGNEMQYAPLSLSSGLYHYMSAHALKRYPFLRLYALFFTPGDRLTGLDMLHELAAGTEEPLRTEAAYFLMRIYLDTENKPLKAMEMARDLMQRYPDNLLFMHYGVQSLRRSGMPAEAARLQRSLRVKAHQLSGLEPEQRAWFLKLSAD